MQHIKTIEKLQELLVFKIQLLIFTEEPPKKTNKGQFGGLKRSNYFKGKLLSYPIDIGHKLSS